MQTGLGRTPRRVGPEFRRGAQAGTALLKLALGRSYLVFCSLHRPTWKKNLSRRGQTRGSRPKDRANLRTPQSLPRSKIGQANDGGTGLADLSHCAVLAQSIGEDGPR